MQVFIVYSETIDGCGGECEINGAFSSYEKAESFRNRLGAEIDEDDEDAVRITIEEREIDEEL